MRFIKMNYETIEDLNKYLNTLSELSESDFYDLLVTNEDLFNTYDYEPNENFLKADFGQFGYFSSDFMRFIAELNEGY